MTAQSTGIKLLQLRVPYPLAQALSDRAAREGKSINALCAGLLQTAVNR